MPPLTNTLQRLTQPLAAAELWAVGLAVAASMALPRLLPLAVGMGVFFWLVRLLGTGRLTRRTPADWAIALLLAMVPVTLWATALPEQTIPQVLRLLTGIALFYALVNWATVPGQLRLLLLGTLLAALGLIAIAPFTVVWATNKLPFIPAALYDRFAVLVADTVHPSVLAANLVILLPVAFSLPLFAWKDLPATERLLAPAVALAGALVLVLTQSRGGLIALAAAALTLAAVRWRHGWVLIPLSAAAGAIALLTVGVPQTLEALTTESTFTSLRGRQEIWSRALYMIQDFPFTGIGMGSFTRVADLLYPFFLAPPDTVRHAHNLFLQIAVDLGLPGLIAWLAIWFTVIAAAWQVYRHGRLSGQTWLAGLGAGLLAGQVALGVHGMVEAVVWGLVRPAPIVWGLWGVTIASYTVLAGMHPASAEPGAHVV